MNLGDVIWWSIMAYYFARNLLIVYCCVAGTGFVFWGFWAMVSRKWRER